MAILYKGAQTDARALRVEGRARVAAALDAPGERARKALLDEGHAMEWIAKAMLNGRGYSALAGYESQYCTAPVKAFLAPRLWFYLRGLAAARPE